MNKEYVTKDELSAVIVQLSRVIDIVNSQSESISALNKALASQSECIDFLQKTKNVTNG